MINHEAEDVLDVLAGKRPGNPIHKVLNPYQSFRKKTNKAWSYTCPWCGCKPAFHRLLTRKRAKDLLYAHSKTCSKWPKEKS